jgi:hypothetical protein
MTDTTTITIPQSGIASGPHWRRFAAGLCFIDFYYYLLIAITRLWLFGLRISLVLMLLRACVMFGLGRALWRNRYAILWLVAAGVVLLSFNLATSIYVYMRLPIHSKILSFVIDVLARNSHDILWLTVLMTIWFYLVGKRPRRSLGRPEWVLLAVRWSLGWLFLSLLCLWDRWFWLETGLGYILKGYGYYKPSPPVQAILMIIPLATAICLIMGKRAAVFFATAMFFIEAVPQAQTAYNVTQSIYAQNQKSGVSLWMLIDQGPFQSAFVQLPYYAVPWLLIAWFAWRAPMKPLPDDGSPWPRRYCGKCGYNLHGVDGGRCPECGLVIPSQVQRAPVQS